ncbi:unnamed protein product [Somion occarium]|uniref:Uncharacterized protein n=1 Tax=Somion occarium TaxID=3059160 RepID=A0ABP1DRV4_9APHY
MDGGTYKRRSPLHPYSNTLPRAEHVHNFQNSNYQHQQHTTALPQPSIRHPVDGPCRDSGRTTLRKGETSVWGASTP